MTLQETIEQIEVLDKEAMEKTQKRWDSIAKPLHSLGKLEDIAVQIAGITKNPEIPFEKKALIAFCADNGVVAEGVTQTGQDVTAIVAENFLIGETSVCVMCRKAGVEIFPYDFGMIKDTKVDTTYKSAYGTKNFAKEPAMTREEAQKAIEGGIEIAGKMKAMGYHVLTVGEMGIGNTTTSSAVASVLLEKDPKEMTGKGAGLTSEGIAHKAEVIKEAIDLHRPDPKDPIDVISKIGGFDIAGMVGLYLGAAANRIPVILDGFISCVAALAAIRLCAGTEDYLIASHVSKEPATNLVLQNLHKEAVLHADMCLGEGTGAVAVIPFLEMGLSVYHSMSTFDDINVEQYEELS